MNATRENLTRQLSIIGTSMNPTSIEFYLVACDPLRNETGCRPVQNLGHGAFWDWAQNCATQAVCFGLVPRPYNWKNPGNSAIWITRELLSGWGCAREWAFY